MNLPGYRVIEHLSRTRRFDTYEVWSEERACSCVAKTLRPDRRRHGRARAALLAEGRRLVELAHPHVVRGYEVIADPDPVVIMETLDGETVAHLVDRHPGGLPAEDVAWLGIHLSSALRFLHAQGLLHLDVKGSNVVADGGRAKLLDLSLARPPGRYEPGIGTWCYLSPEQERGDVLGPAADVWGVGVVLYEAATGDEVESRPPSARGRTADALAAAIDDCLQPDPAARPGLGELMRRLEPIANADALATA
jgi:serine/threonine protein kinase